MAHIARSRSFAQFVNAPAENLPGRIFTSFYLADRVSPIGSMTQKTAILFDLDDTLIIDEVISREVFAKVSDLAATRFGVDREAFGRSARSHARRLWGEGPAYAYCRRIGISAFECLWGNFTGDSADLTQLRNWSLDYRKAVFDAAFRELQIEPDECTASELARAFYDQRRKLQRLMPDARETLTRLASKYKLGLLTNGAPDLQREKLQASGLESFFSAVAISGERDIGKPRPEIFFLLLEELGASPEGAVMVGNSLERDIAGARNAGITNVWIRVAGSEEHDDVLPDFTIAGLSELPTLLEKLEIFEQSI